jgi:hypothetical protein
VVRYLGRTLPKITIFVGVAAFLESGDSPRAVIKAADEALYRAKEQGRNRVETASPLDTLSGGVVPALPIALQNSLGTSFVRPDSDRHEAPASVGDTA